jgi:GT2 family glycosyltransferase
MITPARNEEQYIGKTLESMVRQTNLPIRWVIVSDGSTDHTDGIVDEYARSYSWIKLIRLPTQRDRSFAAKVQGFNAGLEQIKELPFDVLGNLDADISFDPDYFEFLLEKFEENETLGVAGTPFVEDGRHYDYRFTNIEHVSGACQLFRRACFEQIGGYVPIASGGIDWTAVTTARMKGWQTRTFVDKTCVHHRPMGTGSSRSQLKAIFRHGQKDYALGGHPVWQAFRSVYQITRPPILVGGAVLWAGYMWACLSRRERPISQELLKFNRAEQMTRLKSMLFRTAREN